MAASSLAYLDVERPLMADCRPLLTGRAAIDRSRPLCTYLHSDPVRAIASDRFRSAIYHLNCQIVVRPASPIARSFPSRETAMLPTSPAGMYCNNF
jgi:hypothetical protein